jgi:hypothetical protein
MLLIFPNKMFIKPSVTTDFPLFGSEEDTYMALDINPSFFNVTKVGEIFLRRYE